MKFNFFKKIWGKKEDKQEEVKPSSTEIKFELKEANKFKVVPLITEKSSLLAQKGKYVFLSSSYLNKNQLKEAIEKMFAVKVRDIKTLNYKEKIEGVTKIKNRRKKFKKVIVTLKDDQKIALFE